MISGEPGSNAGLVGLAVGKFDPPHRGHALLIDVASARCARTIVYVFEGEGDTLPAAQRAAWLREIHPTVDVRVLRNVPGFDRSTPQTVARSAEAIAELVRCALGEERIDLVFTSEAYGEVFARALDARHHSVDRDRILVPCTGTMIRRAPQRQLRWLEPVVRAHYVPRVCITGAESTGKSTLCERLAEHFGTNWVPEYGREYAWSKSHTVGLTNWEPEEFIHIAFEQQRREDDAARRADPVLICDTDALATGIWHEFYLHEPPRAWPLPPPRITLYLLAYPDVPFVADRIREGEHRRFWMHERFVSTLSQMNARFSVLEGTYDDRFEQAVTAIDALLAGE